MQKPLRFEISTDPRAMEQYSTLVYRGPKFQINPRWLGKFRAENAMHEIIARKKARDESRAA